MSITSAITTLGRPVAFYPAIARAFGDVNTALIVCQFMYWRSRVGEREIYKTQAEIEQETFVPAHTQRRVLKRLSDLGMVTVEKKGIPARNHFEWHWDVVDTFVSDYILQSQQDVTTSANNLSPLDVTDCRYKTEQIVTTNTETTTETTTENLKPLSGKPDVAEKVIQYLNDKTGRKFRAVPSQKKFIDARIAEGATVDDLIAVIDRKCLEWLDDPKFSQYLRPSTLFNAEKFNTYIGQLDAPLPAVGASAQLDPNDTSWIEGIEGDLF